MSDIHFLIDAYLDYLKVERNLSRSTLEAYARDIGAFAEYALGQGLCPADITADHLTDHLARLSSAGLSKRSQARALSKPARAA
jgi:site-specific recombinase XerD